MSFRAPKPRTTAALAVLWTLGLAPIDGAAQPTGRPDATGSARQPPGHEQRGEGRDAGADDDGADYGKLDRKARFARIRDKARERREKRTERRQERRSELRARVREILGERPLTPAIVGELRTHARRVARLERLREIAAELERDEVVTQLDELLRAERERHEQWMARAKERAAMGPAATP
ncbi:MAG: hypothetical protein IT373_00850 [Polyangiaceae bacterium]|nr:hypothetical protein [Polyangiaceae bacterium]